MPRVDPNNPDVRIISFRPFYFSLGYTFLLLAFFMKVFCAMEYAPSRSGLDIAGDLLLLQVSAMKTMWNTDVLEVNRKWEGEVGDSLLVPITYCHERDISKKLDLKPNMAKVHQALNISARFREWGCQLNGSLAGIKRIADPTTPVQSGLAKQVKGNFDSSSPPSPLLADNLVG
ncbi:unnamed protein product [Prunus armeniaca]